MQIEPGDSDGDEINDLGDVDGTNLCPATPTTTNSDKIGGAMATNNTSSVGEKPDSPVYDVLDDDSDDDGVLDKLSGVAA